jgi:hypothetical protein
MSNAARTGRLADPLGDVELLTVDHHAFMR